MPSPIRILHLEDSSLDAELVAGHLRKARLDHAIERVQDRDEFRRALGERPDVILADYVLPGFDGLGALAIARECVPHTPFIFVSGTLGEDIAIESLKQGATDYVVKHRLNRLGPAVMRALAEAKTRAERQRSEAQLRILVAELSHRVNNTLAVVQSITRQTIKNSASLEEFEAAYMARLLSLAKTHNLLARSEWAGASLREVCLTELEPYQEAASARVTLTGPDVKLTAGTALTLALTFHELATNAAKYGALSVPEGCLRLSWRWDADGKSPVLRICWTEKDGPPITAAPTRRGFGSRLIEQSVRGLGGAVRMEHSPDGLCCEIDLDADLGQPAAPVFEPAGDHTDTAALVERYLKGASSAKVVAR